MPNFKSLESPKLTPVVVNTPDVVKVPLRVRFSPEKVAAVVSPDLIIRLPGLPVLWVKEPNVVVSSFKNISAPLALRSISPLDTIFKLVPSPVI